MMAAMNAIVASQAPRPMIRSVFIPPDTAASERGGQCRENGDRLPTAGRLSREIPQAHATRELGSRFHSRSGLIRFAPKNSNCTEPYGLLFVQVTWPASARAECPGRDKRSSPDLPQNGLPRLNGPPPGAVEATCACPSAERLPRLQGWPSSNRNDRDQIGMSGRLDFRESVGDFRPTRARWQPPAVRQDKGRHASGGDLRG